MMGITPNFYPISSKNKSTKNTINHITTNQTHTMVSGKQMVRAHNNNLNYIDTEVNWDHFYYDIMNKFCLWYPAMNLEQILQEILLTPPNFMTWFLHQTSNLNDNAIVHNDMNKSISLQSMKTLTNREWLEMKLSIFIMKSV